MSFVARPSLLRAVGTAPALRAGAFAPRAAVALARRYASTSTPPVQDLSEMGELKLLNTQRMNRPSAPHLEIYQPQLTWLLSGLNRITGVALAGLLYGGALVYLLHPIYPAIDSAHLIEFVHGLPGWLKTTGKLILAVPFTFHSFNGLRHLMWDVGKGLTMKKIYGTGYAVMAATAISSIYLAFFV